MATWTQESPLGPLTVVTGPAGVRRIDFGVTDAGEADDDADERIARELDEYFAGARRTFTVPVDLSSVRGAFHRRCLETLATQVGYGETVTYGELGALAGNPSPRVARAVGQAMGANPVPVIVPCHRVVAAHGLGGYGGRLDRKQILLSLEGVLLPEGANR